MENEEMLKKFFECINRHERANILEDVKRILLKNAPKDLKFIGIKNAIEKQSEIRYGHNIVVKDVEIDEIIAQLVQLSFTSEDFVLFIKFI